MRCHYAEYHVLFAIMLSVFILIVVMASVIAPFYRIKHSKKKEKSVKGHVATLRSNYVSLGHLCS